MTDIDGPLNAIEGLDELEALFKQLHGHHQKVSAYHPLVSDLDRSWMRRRRWYEDILDAGGSYFVARDRAGAAIGYGLVEITLGPDDTFEVGGGTVEIVSLVVDEAARDQGVGGKLIEVIRGFAGGLGAGALKVAVMSGNRGAETFYTARGFVPGEQVLFRSL